jgi:hypothetical protein
MTDEKNNAEDAHKPVPEEPELLTLWRRLIERRDTLKLGVEDWESPNHPLARQHARVAELHGSHGISGDAIRKRDENARRKAERLRAEIDAIDQALTCGTRDKSNANSRGISIEKLRELASPRHLEVQAARAALVSWWSDPDDAYKRRRAAELLHCVLHPAPLDIDVDVRAVLSPQIDLDALRAEELEFRRARAGSPSGTAEASVSRILGRLL